MGENTYSRYRLWVSQPLTVSPEFSVVIPAYNEAIRILPTIGAIAAYMCSRPEPWELVVADDGSTDETVNLLNDLDFPNMTVLKAAANGGKGSAVRRGVLASRGEFILLADADQSTPIEQFDLLLTAVRDHGAAMAIGSRRAPNADVAHKSGVRHLASAGLNLLVRKALSIEVLDTQCGFKLLTADVARDLFSRQQLDGFSFDLELIYLCHRLGYPVHEIPVRWIDAPGSTVDTVQVSADFLRDMGRIARNARRGVYDHPRVDATPHSTISQVPAPRVGADHLITDKEGASWK